MTSLMLAKSVKSISKINWKQVILEPKIDGIRMAYSTKYGAVSRTGKPIANIDHILKELKQLNLMDWTLDGELFAGNWEKTMSLATSHVTKKPNTDLKYIIFDVMHPKYPDLLLSQRKTCLMSLFFRDFKYIKMIPYILGDNIQNAKLFFLTAQKVGYEGIMIKDNDAPYVFKRSSFWLKYKSKSFTDNPTLETMDCKIIGMTEGEGKYKNTLGALVVMQPNKKICKVSGMTDKQRNLFWRYRDKAKNTIVEVAYQELSDNKIMRFPVFKRIRVDKKV